VLSQLENGSRVHDSGRLAVLLRDRATALTVLLCTPFVTLLV
jgi:hypothetical protein